MDISFENISVIRSKRKTISIHIKPDGSVEMRGPLRMSHRQAFDFFTKKKKWIVKNLNEIEKRSDMLKDLPPLTAEDIKDLAQKAIEVIPPKVKEYSDILGVTYGRITIRNQRSRWGSCSSKGNLNFNCLLILAPDNIIDYVVVHELCHRKEMNHSKRFWSEVEKVLPDYKDREKWLRENGEMIMIRMTG